MPPHEVQQYAGHASIETTMKYYAKVDKSARQRIAKAAEEWAAKAG